MRGDFVATTCDQFSVKPLGDIKYLTLWDVACHFFVSWTGIIYIYIHILLIYYINYMLSQPSSSKPHHLHLHRIVAWGEGLVPWILAPQSVDPVIGSPVMAVVHLVTGQLFEDEKVGWCVKCMAGCCGPTKMVQHTFFFHFGECLLLVSEMCKPCLLTHTCCSSAVETTS